MSIYDSLPLDSTRREIRLLHLHTGLNTDPIETHLTPTSLTSNPTYNVLLYAWGPENEHVTIKTQDQHFRVTRNLYQCLVRLRRETEELVIWIDAICINQGSNQEKNTQVPLMRDIYLLARRTFVWLGEVTDGLGVVVKSIEGLAAREEGFKLEKLERVGDGLDASPEAILAGRFSVGWCMWLLGLTLRCRFLRVLHPRLVAPDLDHSRIRPSPRRPYLHLRHLPHPMDQMPALVDPHPRMQRQRQGTQPTRPRQPLMEKDAWPNLIATDRQLEIHQKLVLEGGAS